MKRDLQGHEVSKFTDIGPRQSAVMTNDLTTASNLLSVAGETIAFTAGAAGTTGVVSIDKAPIYDAYGSKIGAKGATSFAWVTGTVLTTEVDYDDSLTDTEMLTALSHNGMYAINYVLGRLYYKKATTGTSDTCNYYTRQLNIEITGAADIEIGAVELKNAATDDRALISDANTARAVTDHVLTVQQLDASGTVPPSGSTAGNAPFAKITDGTTTADVLVQDAVFGTAAKGFAVFGKYQATPTTYTDNDAAPILLDANGRIVLSSDIEIGSVELKDAAADTRASIIAANTAAIAYYLGVMPARYLAAAPTLTDTFSSPLLLDVNNQLKVVDTAVGSSVATPTTLTGGEKTIAISGTAEALGASLATKSIYIRAKSTNTVNVFVGDSNVDATTSQQIILAANDSVTIDIANRATVYIDAALAGEGVDYLCMG